MANVKFIAASRGLRGIVDYVTNREKTVEKLISGVNCVARTAVPEFEAVKKQFRKTEGRGYYHIVQAFAPDDPLDFTTAHELGVKLAEHFEGYQCIVVTHMNTAHIHNHIIMNSVNFETGMKFHQSAREMQQVKDYCSQLCREYGLSVTESKADPFRIPTWKRRLTDHIKDAMEQSRTQQEFVAYMNAYSELASQQQMPAASDERVLSLTQELTARRLAVYMPKYTDAAAQVNARIRQLGSQYQQEKEQCSQLKPGYQCPTCRRAVTADELPAMQNAFRTSIKQIVEAGQAERAKLEELQALEKKARDTFLQFQKDDIAKLEETLQEAKEAAEPDATRPEAQQLQERMQALAAELEFGALSQEEYDRMFACREELQQVRADIAAIEKATPASGDLDSQLKAARAEIDQCKLKLQYLAQYISKRAEMTFSALKMNRVEISLYDVVKSTGEVKDAFKFTYNGRRYDWLSLSEKIRAGMEVSELMKRLTGRNYPQFVDNMESVDDLANVRPTGQVIMAKCVSKAELSVRPVKPILTAMPTAA